MPCKFCKTNPVINLPNSEINLCKSCFIKYFEKKAIKTIKQYKLIEKNDHVMVACSGGKDSLSLLYVLNKLSLKERKIKVTALLIDEGIKGYRDDSIKDAKKFCKEHKIKLHIASYKKELGKTLDQMKSQNPNKIACSMCGVFRRSLLNKSSRELKATKLATGHNLDDEAQSILMNQLRNNIALSSRMGPRTGTGKDPRFIPRIKPFYFLTEKEVATYAFLKGLISKFNECTYNEDSYRFEIRDLLNNLEQKYPGTKHSLVASFIEILPTLKKSFKGKSIGICKTCGEPTSSNICKVCNLTKEIN
ncbi:MAG: TIGR00269 family protein [Nanoarchaeota archaeon]|nr:TIGR00269 family protein [Nanoarchaeota archaeon]|tara:strand:+ start:870 stop:1784 length:915 start_codon:yes stop_codon:yes gene_type:complete